MKSVILIIKKKTNKKGEERLSPGNLGSKQECSRWLNMSLEGESKVYSLPLHQLISAYQILWTTNCIEYRPLISNIGQFGWYRGVSIAC